MGIFFSRRPMVVDISDDVHDPNLDMALFQSVDVESLYGSWGNICVDEAMVQLSRKPETQDTCLNEGEGEREDTRYQVQDELVARVHKRHSVKIPTDEENSAAGAGIFSDDDEMDDHDVDTEKDRQTTHKSANDLKDSVYSGGAAASNAPSLRSTYLNAETLQMLDEPLESVQKRKQHAGSTIADALQRQMVTLMEQVDPEETANQLFGVGIISAKDVANATNKAVDKEHRANQLILLLIGKLRGNPHWFDEACVALDKAGVSAVQDVRALVMRRCPEDVVSTSTYHTCPSEVGGSIYSGFYSLGSFKRLHIIRDLDMNPPPMPEHPLEQSSSSTSSASTEEDRTDVTVTRLESVYKLNGLARARKLMVRQSSEEQINLLHGACRADVDPAVLNLLITEYPRCNLNATDQHGRTPLHIACAAIQPNIASVRGSLNPGAVLHVKEQLMKIENLLSSGANCCIQDEDGNTPLHLAALRRNADAVKLLLKYTASCINCQNKLGNTALHIACREGLVEIVQLLCAHKADTALQNNQKGRTPLHLACVGEHVEVAKCVALYDPSSLHGIDKDQRTALHLACKRHVPSLVTELVRSKSCVPYRVDKDLKTPLHYACYWGNPNLVTPLLERNHGKAFVDAQDRNGNTALHIASHHGHRKVVKELQRRKANQHIKNYDGKTPADLAMEEENDLAAKMVVKKENVLSWREKLKTLDENVCPSPASFRSSMSSIISQISVVLISSDEEDDDETFLQSEDPDMQED